MTRMWKGERGGTGHFCFKNKRPGLCHPFCAVTAWLLLQQQSVACLVLQAVAPLPPAWPGHEASQECLVSLVGSHFHRTGRPGT